MSLSQVFAAFSSFQYASSSSQSFVSAGADQRAPPLAPISQADAADSVTKDVYTSSTRYRFEASYGVYTNKAETYDAEHTDAANTILGFIGNRLSLDQTEGASDEDLSSRLSAGLEGFIRGYQEAYAQLSALGFLNSDVERAIETTFSDVMDGVDDIAETLGIDSPVTEAVEQAQSARRAQFETVNGEKAADSSAVIDQVPVSVDESGRIDTAIRQAGRINEKAETLRSLIHASSYNYQQQETRSFNFSLTTQDGDKVQIRAAYDTVSLFNGERVAYAEGDAFDLAGRFHASSGFYLDVRGELDEDEFRAIEELLSKVKAVSDSFFSGEYEKAFEYALALGFDDSEIVEFSLQLRYQSLERTQARYQPALPDGSVSGSDLSSIFNSASRDPRLALIADFVQTLEALRLQAKEWGIFGFAQEAGQGDEREAADYRSPPGIVSGLLARLEEAEKAAEMAV